jgi:hypothetical protein
LSAARGVIDRIDRSPILSPKFASGAVILQSCHTPKVTATTHRLPALKRRSRTVLIAYQPPRKNFARLFR